MTRLPVTTAELSVAIAGPLTVAGGETVTHRAELTNHGDTPVTVLTSGDLIAAVVDPATGETVGGFSGWHEQPLITFRAEPGQTVRIPLLVGTASLRPADGGVVPTGAWQLIVPVDLDDGRRLVAGPFDVTVTG